MADPGSKIEAPHPNPVGDEAAALRQQVDDLRAALRHAHRLTMLGTLLGSIVHEFNNILTPVMSYSELALESPDDPGLCRKAIERAYQGCDRASKIAEAILSFAGGEQRDHHRAADADVAEVVRETMLCLAFDPARTGVVVSTDIEPGCRAAIDPVSLQQILLNLVINSFKSMKPGGGRLTIRAGAAARSTWNIGVQRPPEPVVVIEVEDTGCGIEPDQINSVFDPFVSHRARIDASAKRSGTGLGLTVCRQLVETAGGRISVRSQVSTGTCFTITVPSAKVERRSIRASA